MAKSERAETDPTFLLIRKVGNSVGLILPKEVIARLKLAEGDKLYLTEQTERSFKLTPYDPNHARGMEIARQAFRDYADTFKALAR